MIDSDVCKKCNRAKEKTDRVYCSACNEKHTKTRRIRLAQGLCTCGNRSRKHGAIECKPCYIARLKRDKDNYTYRKENGICIRCGAEPVVLGSPHCARCKEKRKADTAARHLRIKGQVFSAYGSKCVCCFEQESSFLQVDHINNDGAAQRKALKGKKFYDWIIKSGFPKDLQLLCANCNQGKQLNKGVCPHKKGITNV